MKLKIEIDEDKIKELIVNYIEKMLGDLTIDPKDVHLLVKSKQNYKTTWEDAGVLVTSTPEDKVPQIKADVERTQK